MLVMYELVLIYLCVCLCVCLSYQIFMNYLIFGSLAEIKPCHSLPFCVTVSLPKCRAVFVWLRCFQVCACAWNWSYIRTFQNSTTSVSSLIEGRNCSLKFVLSIEKFLAMWLWFRKAFLRPMWRCGQGWLVPWLTFFRGGLFHLQVLLPPWPNIH